MAIRFIDAGVVSYVRSQTIYHGLAYARHEKSPDTIILISPETPYVCIGFHQELEKEVDVAFCHAHGIPILRREVGGGAVYLDRNQVFTQWVMSPDRLPWNLERRFEVYASPLVKTYRALGVEANFRPVNDIHVAGRKIGGTGAAAIGNAEVVVGSLMFDFDTELMAKVLKVPSEKFRDKVYQSLQEYMTTLKKELDQVPDRQQVKEIYLQQCQEVLHEEIVPGELTAEEEKITRELDRKFVSKSWLYQKTGLQREGVKIHQDVWVAESTYKAAGGLIRATAIIRQNRLHDISISGDFTFHPHPRFRDFELHLKNLPLDRETIEPSIKTFYQTNAIQTPGIEVEDWIKVILGLKNQ